MGAPPNSKPVGMLATKMETPRIARFGAYELDLATGELRKSGIRVRLQEQPFQVLVALIEKPGDVVLREELHARLWPDTIHVDFEQGLNKAVNKLRTALGDRADNPRFVETLSRRGYRFVAPVEIRECSALQETSNSSEIASSAAVERQPRLDSIVPERDTPLSTAELALDDFPASSSIADLPPQFVDVHQGALPRDTEVNALPFRLAIVLPAIRQSLSIFGGALLAFGVVSVAIFIWTMIQAQGNGPRIPTTLASDSGTVTIWSAADNRFLPLVPSISGDGVSISADGMFLTFSAYPSAKLYVMRRDGCGFRELVAGIFERTYMPELSPDGERIAFAGLKPGGRWKVYMVNRDGSDLHEVNPGPGTEADPSWSPDGNSIALAPFPWENKQDGTGIFIADAQSGAVRFVHGSRGHYSPAWSPRGRFIAALTEHDRMVAICDLDLKMCHSISAPGSSRPVWDREGGAVYYLTSGRSPRVERYVLATGRTEPVVSLEGVELRSNSPSSENIAPWFGLTEDDQVLLLRARSIDDVN